MCINIKKINGLISSIIIRNSTKAQVSCKSCNRDDGFTLYEFKDGIKVPLEIVDFDSYFNLVGGRKIR